MKVAIFCERINHYLFFRRLIKGLNDLGHEAVFLTNRLSVVCLARKDGHESVLLRELAGQAVDFSKSIDSYEVEKGFLSAEMADSLVRGVFAYCRRFFSLFRVDQLWIWNGSNLLRQTLVSAGKEHGIWTLFFETGNFPGKLFVDPDGVNFRSRFARLFPSMDQTGYDPEKFDLWRQQYIESKLKNHKVSHAKKATEFNWFYPLDILGFYLLNAPSPEPVSPLRRTLDYVKSKNVRLDYDNFDCSSANKYLFFPLQVSTDSQLLWNSSVDNLKAIEIASDRAKEMGWDLIVKPHPAEGNLLFVEKLSQMRDELGFLFVDDNTFKLMKHSEKVITINSTVGMEAMLLGKSVEILGRSVYENFSLEDLGFYIQCYLIDIDYNGYEDVPRELVQKILKRSTELSSVT